jgi:adenosylmethionine-8-amino-7-oxononanoate aminotransferase
MSTTKPQTGIAGANLLELDARHIWHPFTQSQTAADPIPIVRGEGAVLYDEVGKSYLDGVSSWWVNLHGHSNPYIADRLADQARTLEHVIFAGFTHPPAVELCARLSKHLPGDVERCFFSDNGSTSVEVAIKMAVQYWHNAGRPKTQIIALEEAYHGDTFGAMSVSGRGAFTEPFFPFLFDIVSIPAPIPGSEEDSVTAMQAALQGGEVAAFIYEPLVQGAGGDPRQADGHGQEG